MFLVLGFLAAATLQPNVHDHSQEFEQVVDPWVAVNDTASGYPNSPSFSGHETVPSDSKGACV